MFRNDYGTLCAKEVISALTEYVEEENVGYGLDKHTKRAEKLILHAFGLDDKQAEVHFLAGGTQVNMTVISHLLRPYEAVICCDTGHINVHETGAVEGAGHKILTAPNSDGKLLPVDVERLVKQNADEHTVKPKLVYVSDSTETGTVYTASELTALRKVCDDCGLLLFIDGARLGIALTCANADANAELIGKVADVFYVGGTKNGAMYGEAVVIKNNLATDFRRQIKNRGAMLAKGFAVGIQFEALFEDGLFFRLAQKANDTAKYVKTKLTELGVEFDGTSCTNQIFVKVKPCYCDELIAKFGLERWTSCPSYEVLRIVTSFANTVSQADELIGCFADIMKE